MTSDDGVGFGRRARNSASSKQEHGAPPPPPSYGPAPLTGNAAAAAVPSPAPLPPSPTPLPQPENAAVTTVVRHRRRPRSTRGTTAAADYARELHVYGRRVFFFIFLPFKRARDRFFFFLFCASHYIFSFVAITQTRDIVIPVIMSTKHDIITLQ